MSNSFIRKCFACKQSIDLFDNNTDVSNLLFADNRFYHKDCYIKMNLVKKKCYKCKKDIVYGMDVKEKGVCYDKHYFHDKCFDEWCNLSKTAKRKFAIENKKIFVDEYEKNMGSFLKNRLKQNYSLEDMNHAAIISIEKIKQESMLNSFLKDKYNLNLISSNVWRRLNSIYKGTYKNLEKPIPANHLLDMWKRRQKKLDRIYKNNILKGKELNGENLLIYDLAIIVNEYDSYLNWLTKQKLLEEDDIKSDRNDFSSFNRTTQNLIKNKKTIQNDLPIEVDELF